MSEQKIDRDQLVKAITQVTLQRSQAKDVVEQSEKQLMVLQAQLQMFDALQPQAELEEVPVD
jgi:flagellar biosynthesis chaperone FliJ